MCTRQTSFLFYSLCTQEQSVLKLGNEITRLSRFESECVKKDSEIMALQEKLQLRQTNENVVRAQVR